MTPLERFTTKYVVNEETGCWEWQNTLVWNGYGIFYVGGGNVRAHRFAYEHFVGSIPDGLALDHLCRVRHCVNPAHLEPVTLVENIMRGEGVTALNARKTHCKHGHAFDEGNTLFRARSTGGFRRECRRCHREQEQRRYRRVHGMAA